MSEHKEVRVSGHCPYLDDEHSITATYVKVQLLVQQQAFARCTGVHCDMQTQCGMANK